MSVEGKSQSKNIAKFLQSYNISSIYTSPMVRAVSTTKIIADQLGMKYQEDIHLKDRDLGQAEGMTYNQVQTKFASILANDRFHIDWKFPDGETNGDVYERTKSFLGDILATPEGKIERIVVVSHSLVLNYMVYCAQNIGFKEGIWYQFLPGYVGILEMQNGYFQLQQFGSI